MLKYSGTRRKRPACVNALPGAWTTISKNQYDALGQLKNKTLGNKRDASGDYTTGILSTLDYAYNVRGWLLSPTRRMITTITTATAA